MKKHERVKSNILFNEIIAHGHKISNEYFTIFYLEKDAKKPLFGVSAPKKIGNAVIRNKEKRIVRTLILQTKLLFKNNKNYIIIVKKQCLKEKYAKLLDSFKSLIGEIK